jgi:hypothetical protein
VIALTPFNDELDVLEIRLATLDPVVDLHVIAEAPVTHTGEPKPLHLRRHWGRFEPWHEKIKLVTVEDMPSGTQVSEPRKLLEDSNSDCWRREKHQREALMRGLPELCNTETILLSDLDEIPHPGVFDSAARAARGGVISAPRLAMHVGAMRWRWPRPLPGIARFFSSDMLWHSYGGDLEAIRLAKALDFDMAGEPAGWHMAYLGGVNAVKRKLASNAHHEANRAPFNDSAHIADCLLTGADLFDRAGRQCVPSSEEEWPPYLLANRDRFAHLL